MKKLSCIILLFVSILSYSQINISIEGNDKIVYLDSTMQEATQDNYKYYRIVKDYYSEQKEYKFLVYYKNNQIKEESTLSGKDGGSPNGQEINYYENGKKQRIITYIDGRPIGKTISWYKDGNLNEKGEYTGKYEIPGKNYKLNQYWDEKNNQLIIDGNGFYSSSDKNDHQETGKYKDGYKDGVFEGKSLKENTSYKEMYENGKFISGIRTFSDNIKVEYFEIETKPEPKKGIQHFYKFIGKNYRTPDIPRGHKGKVIVKFVVEKNGEINEVSILKDIGFDTGEEAIRVLEKYGDWQPGMQRGQNVRCYFTLPISIQSTY